MTSPDGLYDWLALAGAAAGAIAVLLLIWIGLSLRRIRRAQKVVLGAERRDVVAHASAMQQDFVTLRDWMEEASEKLDSRMNRVEHRLDGALAHSAMLRYDAFGAMSGRQSSSVALLDENRTGVVLSAIVHRSHSHLYVKRLTNGRSDIELSPEEQRVVNMAFEPPAPVAAPQPPDAAAHEPAAEHSPPAAGAAGG